MDAVKKENADTHYDGGSRYAGAAARVYFGGNYEEHWSENFKLLISYQDRRLVKAVFLDGRWQPTEGDAVLCTLLRSERCPAFTMRYFQAAATAYAAAQDCVAAGLGLDRLHERYAGAEDALTAAELLRLMMDDCGFGIETALPEVLRCCGGRMLSDEELRQLLLLQPRTAQVARVLREQAAYMPVALHDSRRTEFRSPAGAVRTGEELTLSVHLLSGTVERAFLLLYGDSGRQELPMDRLGDRFTCTFRAPETPQAMWYSFRLETPRGARFVCANGSGFYGETTEQERGGFRLTVYRSNFDTPAWFRRSVMYQIFPDRFAFSNDGTAERGVKYHRALGQTPELHKSLDEPVRYTPRPFEMAYSPDDFYGGTLKGIEEKLPYLKELGVSCLYLNPIVEARSNHRYDASDYLKVDPILGTNADFSHLCEKAEALGIRVMLDGVFSHTGADSVYFNRYGNYPSFGACQGKQSPYFPWYDFRAFPGEYRSWWGFHDLPEVDENNKAWQDFVVTGSDSVVKQWLRRGAAGWRLDVADELPDEVLALIRRAAKEEKPDAPILGEVWEDAVIKESYGSRRKYALGDSLDSVMNYPLRFILMDFIHRRTDAWGLRDFLISQQMNYPQPMYYALMNLLGSHDTDRIRNAMATPVVLRGLSRETQLALPLRREDVARSAGRELLCAAVQFAIPGVPSIYYGDEQGMWGTGDPFNRKPFREDDKALHDAYAALAARRNGSAALSTGEAVFEACSADVLTVLRYIRGGRDAFGEPAEDGAWLMVLNRGDQEAAFEADASAAGHGMVRGTVEACTAKWIAL